MDAGVPDVCMREAFYVYSASKVLDPIISEHMDRFKNTKYDEYAESIRTMFRALQGFLDNSANRTTMDAFARDGQFALFSRIENKYSELIKKQNTTNYDTGIYEDKGRDAFVFTGKMYCITDTDKMFSMHLKYKEGEQLDAVNSLGSFALCRLMQAHRAALVLNNIIEMGNEYMKKKDVKYKKDHAAYKCNEFMVNQGPLPKLPPDVIIQTDVASALVFDDRYNDFFNRFNLIFQAKNMKKALQCIIETGNKCFSVKK